ncbi:uncharacterized protein LOC127698869 [Mytilus californianus]|uniref:uncharacterized protein LOC127698869 n=1 Tax=Mytilus californianus TaxID=6549 RepID=UPI0022458556|nr:uncharacterized protein LOC127698869 [Mytilus californianus]
MASNSAIHCGPCGYEGITKNAKKWCTNCDEGFCGDCEKSHRSLKLTKDHRIIAIDDYLKIEDFSVNLTCVTHGKKLDLYCKYHGGALCAVCVKSAHKTCRADDIISIDNVSKNAKGSTALADLEETISKTLENVKQCIRDRVSASAKLDIDEQTIKKRILETKLKLNRHLDGLEEKLLHDLIMNHEKYKAIHSTLLKKLEQTEKEFNKLKEQTQRMKLFASDLQVFLGTCQMNKTTMDKTKLLKVEIGKERSYAMDMKLHRVISSLMNDVKQFGEIHITETSADLQLQDANVDQAQMQVRGSRQDTHYVELQLKRKFDIKLQDQSPGCLLLSDGRTLIADFWGSGKLLEYNEKGKYIRDVHIFDKPYDLTEIDTDRIAVTYPDVKRLDIMTIKKGTDGRKILCEKTCFGISYCNGKIFTVVKELGILILNLTGRILNKIKINNSDVFYVAATEDKIYYTDGNLNTVNCCNSEGQTIWTFKNKSVMCSSGITVDNNQNVYVAGSLSNNLTLILQNGEDSKEMLNASDNISAPLTVCYNKNKNLLLFGYKIGNMALYHVS